MKELLILTIFLISFPTKVWASTPFFEYEIWMQAETSLEQGPIEVHGKIFNTGNVVLSLSPQSAALGGMPSNINETTCGLDCVLDQLSGKVLSPGDMYPFLWLSGTQEENLSSWEGGFLSGTIALIPLNSNWRWTQGGFIPELLVHSEFVSGEADANLPFNKRIINLNTAGEYIDSTSPLSPDTVVPEPSTISMILLGLLGIGLRSRVL